MSSASSSPYEINKKKKTNDIGSFLLLTAFALLFLLLSGSSPSSPVYNDVTTSHEADDFGENSSGPAITATKSNPFRLLGRNKVSSSINKKNVGTANAEQANLSKASSLSSSWFGSYTSDDGGEVSTYVKPTNNYYLETFVEYAEQFTEKVNETVQETKKKLRERIGNIFGFFKRIVRRKPKKNTDATTATI